MRKMMALTLFLLLPFNILAAGELDDLKKDLALVRAEIDKEFANLRAAQSEIARIKVIGPGLQALEKELSEKLQAAEKKAASKEQGVK